MTCYMSAWQSDLDSKFRSHPSPPIATHSFSFLMRTFYRSQPPSNTRYGTVIISLHTVCSSPGISLSSSWKLVLFGSLTHFTHPPPATPTSDNHQSILCI